MSGAAHKPALLYGGRRKSFEAEDKPKTIELNRHAPRLPVIMAETASSTCCFYDGDMGVHELNNQGRRPRNYSLPRTLSDSAFARTHHRSPTVEVKRNQSLKVLWWYTSVENLLSLMSNNVPCTHWWFCITWCLMTNIGACHHDYMVTLEHCRGCIAYCHIEYPFWPFMGICLDAKSTDMVCCYIMMNSGGGSYVLWPEFYQHSILITIG